MRVSVHPMRANTKTVPAKVKSLILEAIPHQRADLEEGDSCDDSDPCTVLDACSGECIGVAKDCSALDAYAKVLASAMPQPAPVRHKLFLKIVLVMMAMHAR